MGAVSRPRAPSVGSTASCHVAAVTNDLRREGTVTRSIRRAQIRWAKSERDGWRAFQPQLTTSYWAASAGHRHTPRHARRIEEPPRPFVGWNFSAASARACRNGTTGVDSRHSELPYLGGAMAIDSGSCRRSSATPQATATFHAALVVLAILGLYRALPQPTD